MKSRDHLLKLRLLREGDKDAKIHFEHLKESQRERTVQREMQHLFFFYLKIRWFPWIESMNLLVSVLKDERMEQFLLWGWRKCQQWDKVTRLLPEKTISVIKTWKTQRIKDGNREGKRLNMFFIKSWHSFSQAWKKLKQIWHYTLGGFFSSSWQMTELDFCN